MRRIVTALFIGAFSLCPLSAQAGISSTAVVKKAALCLTKSPELAEIYSETFGPTEFTGTFYGTKSVSVSASGCGKVGPLADQGVLNAIGAAATTGHMLFEIVLSDKKTHAFVLQ